MTGLAVGVIGGNPAETVLVIAPDYRQFTGWCYQHGINPKSPNIRYVSNRMHLYGYHDAWYVDLGTPDGPLRDMLEFLKGLGNFRNAEVTSKTGRVHVVAVLWRGKRYGLE